MMFPKGSHSGTKERPPEVGGRRVMERSRELLQLLSSIAVRATQPLLAQVSSLSSSYTSYSSLSTDGKRTGKSGPSVAEGQGDEPASRERLKERRDQERKEEESPLLDIAEQESDLAESSVTEVPQTWRADEEKFYHSRLQHIHELQWRDPWRQDPRSSPYQCQQLPELHDQPHHRLVIAKQLDYQQNDQMPGDVSSDTFCKFHDKDQPKTLQKRKQECEERFPKPSHEKRKDHHQHHPHHPQQQDQENLLGQCHRNEDTQHNAQHEEHPSQGSGSFLAKRDRHKRQMLDPDQAQDLRAGREQNNLQEQQKRQERKARKQRERLERHSHRVHAKENAPASSWCHRVLRSTSEQLQQQKQLGLTLSSWLPQLAATTFVECTRTLYAGDVSPSALEEMSPGNDEDATGISSWSQWGNPGVQPEKNHKRTQTASFQLHEQDFFQQQQHHIQPKQIAILQPISNFPVPYRKTLSTPMPEFWGDEGTGLADTEQAGRQLHLTVGDFANQESPSRNPENPLVCGNKKEEEDEDSAVSGRSSSLSSSSDFSSASSTLSSPRTSLLDALLDVDPRRITNGYRPRRGFYVPHLPIPLKGVLEAGSAPGTWDSSYSATPYVTPSSFSASFLPPIPPPPHPAALHPGCEAGLVDLYLCNNPGLALGPQVVPAVPPQFRDSCQDLWQWSHTGKSHEVRLCGPQGGSAFFHPNWSNGTAAVRGNRPINAGIHYWEIRISSRLFGTSMMFGVVTRQARMHADTFCNLLGEDEHSWGLSHKGLLWHNGSSTVFCPPFTENAAVTVGLVYNGDQGTLQYFKNGLSLGVAFTGLREVKEDLFPAVSSTAAKTEMTLGPRRRAFASLQDRCRHSVVQRMAGTRTLGQVPSLPLPSVLVHYVLEEAVALTQSTTSGSPARSFAAACPSLSSPLS